MNLMTMCRSSSVPIQSKGVGEELFDLQLRRSDFWHTLGDARLEAWRRCPAARLDLPSTYGAVRPVQPSESEGHGVLAGTSSAV